MKRKALVLFMAVAMISLLLVTQGCDLLGLGGTKAWTLGGTITLNGVTETPVMIAAYYSSKTSPTAAVDVTLVSDIKTVTSGGSFELAIDTKDVTPAAGEYIHILVFADLDSDGALSAGDKLDLTDGGTGDTVFATQGWAYYYYYETKTDYNAKGWNTSHDGKGAKDASDAILEMYSSSGWYGDAT